MIHHCDDYHLLIIYSSESASVRFFLQFTTKFKYYLITPLFAFRLSSSADKQQLARIKQVGTVTSSLIPTYINYNFVSPFRFSRFLGT